MKTKVVFIINPHSGHYRIIPMKYYIKRWVDSNNIQYYMVTTQYAGHAEKIARLSAKNGADIVVAVGGDGTVNEVGRGLIGTGTVMAILPCGSGNGLARHLGIPLDAVKAINIINRPNIIDIDYGLINNHPFFCTCGVGFDAQVSMRFAQGKSRGLASYIEKTLREFLKYRNEKYQLITEEQTQAVDAFIVTCANADQWGNNAYIAPTASIRDGMLDISVIPPFTPIDIPLIVYQLFNRQIDQNKNIKYFKCRKLIIKRKKEGVAHFDGDPVMLGSVITVNIVPAGLKVVAPASISNI